jgi:hypothetical protein
LRITLPSIIFITAAITSSGGSPPRNGTIVLPIQQEDSPEQNYYANAHPYLEESLDTLRKRIPELGKIHPADDLQQLPGILQKTASNVDSFFRDIVDVIAIAASMPHAQISLNIAWTTRAIAWTILVSTKAILPPSASP